MQLTDLPIPAFQCVIEHMVATVGLYKALKLRLVCFRFDEEVNRAIFATRICAFDGIWRPTRMRPEVLARRLKGVITRPNRLRDPPTLTITTLAKWLVRLSNGIGKGDQTTGLSYSNTLCDAAAYYIHAGPVKRLLDDPLPLHTPIVDLCSIDQLTVASAVGDLQQVQKLLSEDIDPNVESEYFGYPVQNAALNNHADIVTLLLRRPSRDDACSNDSKFNEVNSLVSAAAFIAASSAGHDSILQHVISSPSVTPSLLQQHHTAAVNAAARNGHTKILYSLFSLQEQLSFPDLSTAARSPQTQAFFTACGRGYPELVQLPLSDYGIDPNIMTQEGRNGLHMAAVGGHARVISLLLKHGTKYYAGLFGDPLFLAAKNGHEDAVRVFLDAGIDIKTQDANPTHVVCACARNGEASMLRYLLSRALSFDNTNGIWDLALKEAAQKGHVETVELLVGDLGVDVDGRKGWDAPMLEALKYGQTEVVRALRALGAREVDVRETIYAIPFEDGRLPTAIKT